MEERLVKMSFALLNVYGRSIPSEESITTILDSLNDKDEEIFCAINNKFMYDLGAIFNPDNHPYNGKDPETIKIFKLYMESRQNYQSQCEILRVNFPILWQSFAVIKWYQFMLGKYKSGDIQKLIGDLSRLRRTRMGKISRDSFKIHIVKDYPILEKYPEYRDALFIVDYFHYLVKITLEINCDLNNLRTSELDILRKMAEVVKHRKITYGIFSCYFCGNLITFTPEGTRKSDGSIITTKRIRKCCGSEECENKYSAGTTEKNRSQPHAINEKKKRSSEKVTTQWIKVDNAARWCVGVCSKRRLVDKHRICEQCHGRGFRSFGGKSHIGSCNVESSSDLYLKNCHMNVKT